ncbi:MULTISPECIES: M56 family metallopeptidase [unclassified Arcicella]|uniref:M56 family metallopeptidase n=1 Tax=unclassified Arcicella TaxID=2644986 RepID=UPI00285B9865|nr:MULTISPECIES: M56 family metallopeptidase [unclassified Arcicella]MDR6561795.1 beta-lactamase regulating signal transducer with metallopeptidase domain/predicted nucleic acid-binding Zn-ribbon protein [Arcicella sp. BE51]MDR6813941.1 beta-lactamase regulating signal transducer with metallopeptidase domain/predicted nucleic acid-binding Zn-ribbon protein [Arcicella sp. BE140]MDR6825352.1 beta-lactamase regulating signal transducer with metallopeptidase domain/predicted nucleic acid-binding Zn-
MLNFFPENVMTAIGWTLLHSVWQLIVIAIVLKVALLISKKSATKRYWLSFAGLFSQLLATVATFLMVFEENTVYLSTKSNLTFDKLTQTNLTNTSTLSSTPNLWNDFQLLLSNNLNLLVSAWLIGTVFLSVRLMGGYIYTEQLRWKHTKSVHGDTLDIFNELLKKINIGKGINLLESSLATTPMTIGFLQPVILLPIGLLTGLSNKEIEAILAHELAHIKRHDYLINIVQSIVEILFFFHPVTWWISAKIREERENCCDDLAIELCGNNIHLVKALTKVEIFQQQTNVTLAMGFAGKKQTLLGRVQRILGVKKVKSVNYAGIIVMSLFALTTLVFVNLPNNAEAQTVPEPPKAPKSPKAPKPPKKGIKIVRHDFNNNFNISDGNLYFNGERIILSGQDSIKVAQELQVIDKLEKQMEPHSQKIEALSKEISVYSQKINEQSKPINDFSAKVSTLGSQLGKLGEKQGKIAINMINLKEGSQAKKNAELEMKQIEKEMKVLEDQIEKYGAEMGKIGEKMNIHSAPIDSLSKLIEFQAKPIEALGKEIELHAKEIQKYLPASIRTKMNGAINFSMPDAPEPPSPPAPPAAPPAPPVKKQ